MTTDQELNDKVSAKINAVGPCCSCLVTIILLFLIAMFLLQRCR